MSHFRITTLALATFISSTGAASAGADNSFAVVDSYHDFLPTYTAGPAHGDLDVIAAAAFYDAAARTFSFSTLLADRVGLTPGALYVWGIDRGLGTERFLAGSPAIGAGVFFDSVLVVRADGTGTYNDFINGTTTALDPSHIKIGGLAVTVEDLPASLFAPDTEGFRDDPGLYTWNLWPRLGLGSNGQISDFAPDGSNLGFQVTAVPEPQVSAMLLAGMGLIGYRVSLGRRRP
jgi:hypothetical protein